jgi:hypothetical protein
MARWYYARGDRQSGPVSGRELKRLAQSGELLPTDLIWKDGDSERRPAATAPGLFSEQAASPQSGSPSAGTPSASGKPARGEEVGPRAGISLLGVVRTLAALLSILLGGGASVLYWTGHHKPLALPISLLGLLLGNIVLLTDWLRAQARFSIAVLGVTASTVSLITAFLDSGGLTQTTRDLRQVLATLKEPMPEEKSRSPKPNPHRGGTGADKLPSVSPSIEAVRSEDMTREELTAKVESLGNPCSRKDLLKLVGEPQRTETKVGLLAGLFWYWRCKDGMVEIVLLNPDLGSGDEKDDTMAYISKINIR